MRRNSCILTAALLAACCSSAALAQTAVGNAGFEDAMLGQAPPAAGNWASFFGGPPILDASNTNALCGCTIVPRSGASALHLQSTGNSNTFVGVQQPVTGISGGASYSLKIWARAAGPINNAVEYRMEWQDANGTVIGDQFALTTRIDAALTNTYQQFTLTAPAPAAAARANIVLDIQTYSFNPLTPTFDTQVFIDDVEFIQTPGQNACCNATTGACQVAAAGACPSGTTALALNSTCTVNNCPQPAPPVACCSRTNSACLLLTASACTSFGATAGAANSTCTPNTCPPSSTCRADFNGNHALEVQDIFDFLAAWFSGCP